jgi:hypothetical protein
MGDGCALAIIGNATAPALVAAAPRKNRRRVAAAAGAARLAPACKREVIRSEIQGTEMRRKRRATAKTPAQYQSSLRLID